jgi:hypothetical protein
MPIQRLSSSLFLASRLESSLAIMKIFHLVSAISWSPASTPTKLLISFISALFSAARQAFELRFNSVSMCHFRDIWRHSIRATFTRSSSKFRSFARSLSRWQPVNEYPCSALMNTVIVLFRSTIHHCQKKKEMRYEYNESYLCEMLAKCYFPTSIEPWWRSLIANNWFS